MNIHFPETPGFVVEYEDIDGIAKRYPLTAMTRMYSSVKQFQKELDELEKLNVNDIFLYEKYWKDEKEAGIVWYIRYSNIPVEICAIDDPINIKMKYD